MTRHLSVTLLLLVVTFSPHWAPAQTPRTPAAPRTATERAPAMNILSIIPAQAEPGGVVTLYGTGFTEGTSAFLGNVEIGTRVIGPQQLAFEIPNLAPGLYALFLKRGDGATSRIYNFSIQPEKPVVTAISPDRIYACASGGEREIVVSGRHFQERSQLLFDGAVIRSRFSSAEAISFSAPEVAGGLHQVQVRNPEDTFSTVMALFIEARPEIESVTQGEDFVNYYNLVITGRNFQQNSSLIVDGKRLSGVTVNANERERAVFVDCNHFIYERHPYDATPKNFRVQIINPNGEGSQVVQVTAP